MNLSKEAKSLMAYCYISKHIQRYEFSFDKRDNKFLARIFLTETNYFTVEFGDEGEDVKVFEYNVTKSSYFPSTRVTYINKYLRKYRCGSSYSAKLSVSNLLVALDKIEQHLLDIDNKDKHSYWRSVRRATVLF